jgi:alkanesulfonate monooxygenase SsuD/methylene tetrahydromethanopterin reductase-like flavin-dependent oxidoreductase (luciferase family)
VHGAKPGPAPAHAVEIWLGAYKPRMLRLTGAVADGWLPSTGYLDLALMGEHNARIDAAATEAGRPPAAIRRLLNVSGPLGQDAGRLASLALEHGTSTFILAADDADAIRRFAEDTAPALRALVERERDRAAGDPDSPPPPASVTLGDPLSGLEDPGQHLVDVHDGLRAELARLRDLVGQVARGTTDPAAVRSFLNRMTIRQNHWTLGVFCASYCRVVTGHHTLEDRSVFPHLRSRDPSLGPVIDRLEAEHEDIAEMLEAIDRALVGLVGSAHDVAGVQAAVDELSRSLLAHFTFEEDELVGPLSRHGFG